MKNEVKVLFGLGVATASCALLYRYLSKDEFEAAALTKSTQAKKADSIAGAADSFDKEETTALPQAEQQANLSHSRLHMKTASCTWQQDG
jgi:hypothetical protein